MLRLDTTLHARRRVAASPWALLFGWQI